MSCCEESWVLSCQLCCEQAASCGLFKDLNARLTCSRCWPIITVSLANFVAMCIQISSYNVALFILKSSYIAGSVTVVGHIAFGFSVAVGVTHMHGSVDEICHTKAAHSIWAFGEPKLICSCRIKWLNTPFWD